MMSAKYVINGEAKTPYILHQMLTVPSIVGSHDYRSQWDQRLYSQNWNVTCDWICLVSVVIAAYETRRSVSGIGEQAIQLMSTPISWVNELWQRLGWIWFPLPRMVNSVTPANFVIIRTLKAFHHGTVNFQNQSQHLTPVSGTAPTICAVMLWLTNMYSIEDHINLHH